MSHNTLSDFVEATATKFGIPGVAVGVWVDGREIYACHGVTRVDNRHGRSETGESRERLGPDPIVTQLAATSFGTTSRALNRLAEIAKQRKPGG